MAFGLSERSRNRLQGVHPDPVRAVERTIQIMTQGFRVRQVLCTLERQARAVRARRQSDPVQPNQDRPGGRGDRRRGFHDDSRLVQPRPAGA
jgi:hypothetical protein